MNSIEKQRMRQLMLEELLSGKQEIKSGTKPMLVVPIAAPGSGKSTVTTRFLEEVKKCNSKHFVEIDLDDAIHFHPKGPDLWNLRDVVTHKPLPIGSTETFFLCRQEAIDVMRSVLRVLLKERKYHIILHGLLGDALRPAKRLGWKTMLVFVAVTRKTAVRRATDRLGKLGRHFTEEDVTHWWDTYRESMASWSLWADNFFIIDNERDGSDTLRVKEIPNPLGNNWYDSVQEAQKHIDSILLPTEKEKKNDIQRDFDLVVGTEAV